MSDTQHNVTNSGVPLQASSSNKKIPNNTNKIKAVLSVAIVVIMIAFLSLYLWGEKMDQLQSLLTPDKIQQEQDPQLSALEKQGNTDDLDAVERDLRATIFTGIDQEFEKINKELQY